MTIIVNAVKVFAGDFTFAELERACPSISRDMIRRVLRDMQKAGEVDAAPAKLGGKEVVSVKEGKRKGNMRDGIHLGRSTTA